MIFIDFVNQPKTTISDIKCLLFTVRPCKINLPKVRWNLIFSVINFLCELPHELGDNLRLRNLGYQEVRKKYQNFSNSGQNLCESRYKSFLILSNFA